MQSGQITLYNLFDGTKVFSIPTYQRAYAWGKRQLEDFTSDFENQILNKAYFFGTILFREAPKQGPFEIIEIVDGQQRITTLMIYLRLILDRLNTNGKDMSLFYNAYIKYGGRYKLHVQGEDQNFFENYILQDHDGSGIISTPSQGRLWTAFQTLKQKVDVYSLDQLDELVQKIEQTRVLVYSVQDKSEATLIFEVTNDRGKPLTNLEKTKAFLMHKTYLASSDAENDLDAIQNYFVDIYRDLELILEKQKGSIEDNILQYHFIAYERWWSTKEEKQYTRYVELVKNAIDQRFHKPDLPATTDYIQKYIRELRETYGIMKHLILEGKKYGLLDLSALGRQAVFYPLLIKTFKLDSSSEKVEFRRIVRLLEVISFRVWGIRRRRSDTGRETLFAMARDFKGDFSILINSLKQFIQDYASDTEFRNRLLDPSFYNNVAGSDQRYLYWKYENYLRNKEIPITGEMSFEEFMTNDQKIRLSIEHIAPQNPKDSRVVSDLSILPQITREFQERWLHSLGNLTIDPLSANIGKSNEGIEYKNLRYFRKAPYKTQNELEDFFHTDAPCWNETTIAERRDKILKFSIDHWNPNLI